MRIVHVTESLDPADGGLPIVPVRHAEASARRGHEVRIVTKTLGPGPNYLSAPGVQISVLLDAGGWNLLLGRGASRLGLAEAIEWADLIHLHGIWGPLIYRTARLAFARG